MAQAMRVRNTQMGLALWLAAALVAMVVTFAAIQVARVAADRDASVVTTVDESTGHLRTVPHGYGAFRFGQVPDVGSGDSAGVTTDLPQHPGYHTGRTIP